MLGSNDLSLLLRVLFGHDVCCAEIASLYTKDFAFIAAWVWPDFFWLRKLGLKYYNSVFIRDY
jgi:hypothetical protein